MKFMQIFKSLSITTGLLCLTMTAFASTISLQGRVVKPDGRVLESSGVTFKIRILSDNINPCILYEETQTKDMTSSGGLFSISLNDGTGVRSDGLSYSFEQIFSNQISFSVPATQCASGSGNITYSPTTTDERNVVLYFKEPSATTWEQLPTMKLATLGRAIESQTAATVGAFAPGNLCRVVDGAGNPLPASAFTSSQWTELLALINGTSVNYSKTGAATGTLLPSYAGTPASATTGSIWYDSSSNQLKYKDNSGVQTVGAAGIGVTNGGQAGPVALGSTDASNLTLKTAGSARMTIDSSGNVGIGTVSPSYSLDVAGVGQFKTNDTSKSAVILTDSAGTQMLKMYASGAVTGDTSMPSLRADGTNLMVNPKTNGILYFGNDTVANVNINNGQFYLKNNGNLGIGTITPAGTLEVQGGTAAASTNGTNITLAAQAAGSGNQNGGNIVLLPGAKTGTGTNAGVLIGTSTNPGWLNANSLYVAGTVYSAAGYQLGSSSPVFWGDSSTLISGSAASGSGYFTVTTSNTERMRVDATGNVGIGTTAPAVSLDLGSKTDAVRLPKGTTAQQPATPSAGMIRWNTTNTSSEIYNGAAWVNIGTVSTSGAYSGVSTVTGGASGVSIAAGGSNQSVSLSASGSGVVTSNSVTTITNVTSSTGYNNGALVVSGGVGISGAVYTNSTLYSAGNISSGAAISAATSLTAPTIFGSSAASGNLSLDSTSNATKGTISLASSGGNVGIGTVTPTSHLHIAGSGATLYLQDTTTAGARILFNANGGASPVAGFASYKLINGFEFYAGNVSTPKMVLVDNGNVGIGTSSPSENLETSGNLKVAGQSYSGANVIASGANVDFNTGNIQVLQSVGGSAITLSNLKNGASYILIITDTTARTYTFPGCTTSQFNPANGSTSSGATTIFNILSVKIANVQNCFISWGSGYQ